MTRPIDDGGAAFPIVAYGVPKDGMTLRDWFAGQALAGILANRDLLEKLGAYSANSTKVFAPSFALDVADAMISAKKGNQ